MNNFLFQNNQEKIVLDNEYFCLSGYQDYFDNNGFPRCKEEKNKNILAKKYIRSDNSIKYMIRTSRDNKLYNPVSLYDKPNQSNKSYINSESIRFKQVSPKVFVMYMNFLKTKNTAWLHNAERESE
jgi:hypothetical protein